LRAGVGQWKPEGAAGPAIEVEAFGEVGAPLTAPAPLIRVVEGTLIVASVRNGLDRNLIVRGLCTRDGAACPPIEVPPSQTREVRFIAGRPGTYHYWASVMAVPIPYGEMAGAFIVDPAGSTVENDRVLVITEWTSLTLQQIGDVIRADEPTEL